MIKKIALLTLVCSFVYSEPSAFELQSGATKNDISSLQSSSKTLQNIVTDLQNRLTNLEQIQDGFKSLISGQNLKIKNFSDTLSSFQLQIEELKNQKMVLENNLKESNNNIDALKAQVLSQQEDIKKLQQSVQEMNRIMTESNNSIIQQLTLMSQFLEKTQSQKPLTEDEMKQEQKKELEEKTKEATEAPKKSDKDLFAEARSLMRKKDFDGAEKIFKDLVKKKYKTAQINYYLGDIAFRKKDYKKAIEFYRKSSTLDEKASYMPILLWRTAWSFKYIGDEENYQKFLDLITQLYPDSEQAKKITLDKEKELKSTQKDKNENTK